MGLVEENRDRPLSAVTAGGNLAPTCKAERRT